jgi:acetyl esterase/lipase
MVGWRHTVVLAALSLVGATAVGVEHRTLTDIPYRASADGSDRGPERCRLDLHLPVDASGFATVVWFHGGGLTKGKREIPKSLRGRGFAVVGAGYRLSPGVKAPVYIEDAAAAVAWTFRSIAEHGGSPRRIYVSGHSAGAYLAAMVGLDTKWLAAHGIEANDLAGIIPCSAQCITHFTVRAERGIPDRQPVIDEFAPLFHVRRDAPPLLLITGDRDREMLGRYEENAYLWRMMKLAGHERTRLVELNGEDHGSMAEAALPLVIDAVTNARE